MEPIYLKNELRLAYQLNWSLSVFTSREIPESPQWLEQLGTATERDGVRILEYRKKTGMTHQFLLSTQPYVVPWAIARSVKGRLQYVLRNTGSRMFRRNYWLQSVGRANCETLQHYVGRQASRHAMADAAVQRMLESLQYHDASVDLETPHTGPHGQHLINYHFVFENRERLSDIREDVLKRTRNMIVRAAAKHDHRLARIGLTSNHFHVLLGCGLCQDPLTIGASYLNNIAYAQGMQRMLDPSFFVGTFGTYDRAAIRRCLSNPSEDL